MEGREKRRRVRVSYRTEIIISHKGGELSLKGDSDNLSQGGILVRTREKVPLGTVCRVRLRLSGTEAPIELTMDGRVVREDPAGFGIQFDEMDLESYTVLKEIVRYNAVDADLI